MKKTEIIENINELNGHIGEIESAIFDMEHEIRKCKKIIDSLPSEVDEIDDDEEGEEDE